MGFDGWGYEDVLPVLQARRGQRARREPLPRGRRAAQRQREPLDAPGRRDAGSRPPAQVGIPRNDDLNGATQEGAGRFQLTQRDGRRCSTAVAYLHPAVARGNVDVMTGHARLPDPLRGRSRGRRRGHARRRARADPRRARGRALDGHLPLAAALDALGRRAQRGARAAGDRDPPRAAGRPEPAGPPDAQLRGPHRQGQPDHSRHAGGLRPVRGARAVARARPTAARAADSCARATASRHPMSSSTSAASCSTRSSSACPSTTPTPSAPSS